jgi:LPXTG-motif cell wall-anchored protein
MNRDRSDGEGASGARLESALVPVRSRVATLLAVLAVAIAPGAAFAQSGGAGDDQYVDPLGGGSQQQQQQSGGSNSSGSSSNGPALSNSPALSAQASPTTAASSSSSPSAQTLPRTGADAGVVAAIGAALLLAGAVLRRRLRHERL